MRFVTIALLVVGLAQVAMGQAIATRQTDDPRQAIIAAAKDSAVQKMLDQIEPALILPNLSVGDFLSQTDGGANLRQAIAGIEPVGGPRWLDERTCQVRLEMSGTEVVVDLANIAAAHPELSPIAANDLPNVADRLSARYFAAIGTSVTSDEAPPPPPESPWAAVPSDVRQAAIESAERDAAQRMLSSIRDVDLAPGIPLDVALRNHEIRQSLTGWITSRPITAVDYRVDPPNQLVVNVALAADPSDLFNILRGAVSTQVDLPHPNDEIGWTSLRQQVIRKIASASGEAIPRSNRRLHVLSPPAWATHLIDATGVGSPSANRLRAARSAELNAIAQIRQSVMDLEIDPGLTIRQARSQDAQLAIAVDRAILRFSHLYQSESTSDGRVAVQISLDLHFIWLAIETHR